MNDLSKSIINTLKSNTLSTVYLNTISKLPIIITKEGVYVKSLGFKDKDDMLINDKALHNKLHNDIINGYDPDNPITLTDDIDIKSKLYQDCRLDVVNKFHYDETWYSHRFSVNKPDETFGIIRTYNLPFKSFYNLKERKSFICRLDQLIYNNYIQPFMLFINNKFVNLNIIDVVFDCNDIYLLIHGEKYNYFDLLKSDICIIIMPFKIEFVGKEPESVWGKNYEMLVEYLQNSLFVNSDKRIQISVPTMDSIYVKNGMLYNIGAWMYSQIRANFLGILPKDKQDKLKRIMLYNITYDNAGNIIDREATKFNALDKDVYDESLYRLICHSNIDYIKSKAVFKFNNDGVLDFENGNNIISVLDESIKFEIIESSDSCINIYTKNEKQSIFKENFIIFKNNLLDYKYDIDKYKKTLNDYVISNNTDNLFIIKILLDDDKIEPVLRLKDYFVDNEYYTKINNVYNNTASIESDEYKMISTGNKPLQYNFFNSCINEDNYKYAFNTIMKFNPLLFNDLTKCNVDSYCFTGKEANENLKSIYTNGEQGLVIPRSVYSDHESFIIVFLNGELIDSYSDMYIASNYFFLPVENTFNDNDNLEILYFNQCDNNEIEFTITDNMISKLKSSEDPKFVKSELFKEYINKNDIKIFADYPEDILIYKDLIEPSVDIAFNISYRNTNNDLLVFNDVIKNKNNKFTAISSRRFIYERLYVDQRAYRIKLDERFKFCDNQKQFILFINGRRMQDDSFFVTVPKYSRPFWGMYLYITKFVTPKDRIEIFYVSEEMHNINTEETPINFDTTGYITANKLDLDVPLNNDFYLYFINGKKIPKNDIVNIDTHTVRVRNNVRSLLSLNINPVYRSTENEIISYMKSNTLSIYDKYIDFIQQSTSLNKLDNPQLDFLFACFTQMTNTEDDKLLWNVDRIAIINEIIRDFWVTSGYEYNELPFVYDYELDEIISKDKNNNYIMPSLDANPIINIRKNYIRLLYLYCNKTTYDYEIGDSVWGTTFNWEFSDPIYEDCITISSQYVNDELLDTEQREYIVKDAITDDTSFHFKFNTMQDCIEKKIDFKFYNGIYYGVVDEDLLENYNKSKVFNVDEVIALIPKDKRIPSSLEQELENESLNVVKKDNYVITDLTYIKQALYEPDPTVTNGYVSVKDPNLIAICKDGTILRNLKAVNRGTFEGEYLTKDDLPDLMKRLTKKLQDTPTMKFNNYKIGSNNYFVYALPKRLAYDVDGNLDIKFFMPDLNDRDLIDYGKDDHTTPIYTNGEFDYQNCLIKLDKFEMNFMGEFDYKNKYGFVEKYVCFKSNGFFTRKYDDYLFNFNIMSNIDYLNSKIKDECTKVSMSKEPTVSKKSFKATNTSAISDKDKKINDNIIMIDSLFFT